MDDDHPIPDRTVQPIEPRPFRPEISVVGPAPTVDRSRDSGPETVGMSRATPLQSLKTPNPSKTPNRSKSHKSVPLPPHSPPTPPQKKELLSPSLRPTATASRSGRSPRRSRNSRSPNSRSIRRSKSTQSGSRNGVKLRRSRSPFAVDPQLFDHDVIRTVSVHGPNDGLNTELSPSPEYVADATPSGNSLKDSLLGVDRSRHCVVEWNESSSAKAEQRRQHIEEEIVSTERTFCRGLDTLLNELLLPMFDRKLIDRQYYRHCVSSVPQMLRFHRTLLDRLEARHRSVAAILSRMVGRQQEQFSTIYLKYIAEYNAVLELFGTTFHGNKRLNQFLRAKRKGIFCTFYLSLFCLSE